MIGGFLQHALKYLRNLFPPAYRDIDHLVRTIPAKERETVQVIMIQQESVKKSGGKVRDITIHTGFEIPAVHLPGHHEINLERLYRKGGKVYRMRAASFGEHRKMIEIMPVLGMYLLVVFMQVMVQPLHQQILLMMPFADAAYIVYRDDCFHDSTKVRRCATATNCDLWDLWYFLLIQLEW